MIQVLPPKQEDIVYSDKQTICCFIQAKYHTLLVRFESDFNV